MKLTGTRVFLEVRVGPLHSVEVVLHVRAADRAWFESLAVDEAAGSGVGPLPVALMHSLEQSILPRWFTDEIVKDMSKHLERKAPPPVLGPGGHAVVIGESNVLAQQLKQQQQQAAAGKKKTRRRGGAKQAAAAAAAAAELSRVAETKKKDVYYAFGETSMQIAYRLQEIATSKQSAHPTLVFTESKGGGGKIKMQSLIKLPRRILLWCSPPPYPTATATNGTSNEESDMGGGFYRPEFIPMGSIFRAPRDEQDDQEEDRQPRAKKKQVIELDD
jgi:hypothetical protein